MITTKLHRLQAPGGEQERGVGAAAQGVDEPHQVLAPPRSSASTATTPTTFRPLIRPYAVAAVAGDSPRSMANGTMGRDQGNSKPTDKIPPQSCRMGVDRKDCCQCSTSSGRRGPARSGCHAPVADPHRAGVPAPPGRPSAGPRPAGPPGGAAAARAPPRPCASPRGE